MRRISALLLCVPFAVLGGCTLPFASEPERPPLTRALQNRLDRLMHQLHYARGATLLQQLREVSAFGEDASQPAIDRLRGNDDGRLRAGGVYVLGEIDRLEGDTRARDAIRGALRDPDRMVRLEASRALLEAGEKDAAAEL